MSMPRLVLNCAWTNSAMVLLVGLLLLYVYLMPVNADAATPAEASVALAVAGLDVWGVPRSGRELRMPLGVRGVAEMPRPFSELVTNRAQSIACGEARRPLGVSNGALLTVVSAQ